jgi:hypothetical protein
LNISGAGGALVRLSASRNGSLVDPHPATPKTIFASKVAKHSESLRPQHTVLELATLLGLTLSLGHDKDDLKGLVADAVASGCGPWSFAQVRHLILSGDGPQPIAK